jgi:SpoVK/Ycf46/Vps4 family AAA+-type ATPase
MGRKPGFYSDRPVAESELILPAAFKRDLLGFVDGFGRAAAICHRLNVTPSRGALFVGAPGTGKTQTVRHLVSRLPEFLVYLLTVPTGAADAGPKSRFELLVEHLLEQGDPAIVVIEDIDRLFETKSLTPQFFLNVMDGLFQPAQPVLWIATSNDPRGLEANLLDRPGRFDRVFVFPMPGPDERLALLRRYCAFPVDEDVLDALVQSSGGLSGAHLRAVCYSAALEAAERPAEFGVELRAQLEKVVAQHGRAKRYDFELGSEKKVGFGGNLHALEPWWSLRCLDHGTNALAYALP